MAQSRYYSSTAQPTVLTGSITPASTTIVVSAVTGFPVTTPYVLALDYATASEELVLVTAAAGTSLTVTRAYDGTSATSHNVAANVRHTWAAADGNDSRFHEGSTGGVHGIAGISAVVGTTDAQTLSNKTLTAPIINSATFTSPTITGSVLGNPTFTAGVKAGSTGQFIVDTNGNVSTTGIGQVLYAIQSADQAVASSIALVNSGISVPMQANVKYIVDGFIEYDGIFGGNGGIRCSWSFPAGAVGSWTAAGAGVSGVAPVQYNSNQAALGGQNVAGTYGTGGTHSTLPIMGWVQTAGTAGNLVFRFAQNISDPTGTTVYANSFIRLTRVV